MAANRVCADISELVERALAWLDAIPQRTASAERVSPPLSSSGYLRDAREVPVLATSQIRWRNSRFARMSKGIGEVCLCLAGVTETRHLDQSGRLKCASEHMISPC